ncbi:hypothetical protein K32_16590 [Kaistia sp. 32K]|uniref:hypothetical protein n=1 Tax=Kaistia sp. 32K TaxID=2795690 RepID=UPI0019166845|nr:hypothetical protein [Kaistia sp. 32K]BCP53042.1 hypothetical protein K32_16590 [Kaistia sp. 32K]
MPQFSVLLVLCTLLGLSGCTTDPNSPAIRAMEPVNACGSGGTQDINACSSNHR